MEMPLFDQKGIISANVESRWIMLDYVEYRRNVSGNVE